MGYNFIVIGVNRQKVIVEFYQNMSKIQRKTKVSSSKGDEMSTNRKIEASDELRNKKLENRVKVQISNNDKKSRKLAFYVQKHMPLLQLRALLFQKAKEVQRHPETVLGFETVHNNFSFDYKLQMGIGQLQNDIELRLFYSDDDKKGLQKFKICCCLAIGGFSKVFLVRSKIDGQFLAAKFIDKSKKQLLNYDLLQNQRQISLKLNSPFLVRTYQFIQSLEFYIFIMQYCPGGQLFYLLKHIKCMTESEARVCFIQILLGIEYLHNAGFMYRDMKPENVLIDCYGFIKIADFGLAKLHSSKSFSFCGSVEYMAPEILRGKGHEKYVDFYCLGALLYEMLIGHPPFYDSRSTTLQTKNKIMHDDIYFPPEMISQEAKDLIRRLTCKNQRERLGYYGGCKEIMTHPWVGKVNRKMYEEKKFRAPFPVDLDKLNFDPEEIGHSERMFQQRINMAMEKTLPVIEKARGTASSHKKSKSQSQKHEKHSLKTSNSPYKNKSAFIFSQTRPLKSPYQNILRKSGSMKKVKTQKSQQKLRFAQRKYLQNIRLTQEAQNKKKQNIMVKTVSKLRKKCRFVPFLTTVETEASPLKYRFLKTKQNGTLKNKEKYFPSCYSHYRN